MLTHCSLTERANGRSEEDGPGGGHNMDIGQPQHVPQQQMIPHAQGQQMVGRTSMAIMQQRMVAERNWLLGLHTRQAPADIMAETFRCVCWSERSGGIYRESS